MLTYVNQIQTGSDSHAFSRAFLKLLIAVQCSNGIIVVSEKAVEWDFVCLVYQVTDLHHGSSHVSHSYYTLSLNSKLKYILELRCPKGTLSSCCKFVSNIYKPRESYTAIALTQILSYHANFAL